MILEGGWNVGDLWGMSPMAVIIGGVLLALLVCQCIAEYDICVSRRLFVD